MPPDITLCRFDSKYTMLWTTNCHFGNGSILSIHVALTTQITKMLSKHACNNPPYLMRSYQIITVTQVTCLHLISSLITMETPNCLLQSGKRCFTALMVCVIHFIPTSTRQGSKSFFFS
jgi:hypothetical protein